MKQKSHQIKKKTNAKCGVEPPSVYLESPIPKSVPRSLTYRQSLATKKQRTDDRAKNTYEIFNAQDPDYGKSDTKGVILFER